ncbi:hypothetical protein PDN13_22855 [Bacillus cereus]|nr:hypothetical protein [Bacillus cereus]MDA2127996.1 hypothetical protein [Bacillus cereus]
MYKSICLKNFKDFKRGQIFNTYERSSYAYLNDEDSKDDEFIKIPFADFKHYFRSITYVIGIPIIIKKHKYKFLKKIEFEEVGYKVYGFDLETKYLKRIQREIFLPLYLLEEDEEFLLEFSYTLNYVLNSLKEISKIYKMTDIDLDVEITRTAKYLNELETLYNNADKSARVKAQRLLENHHNYMDYIMMAMNNINKC